MNTSLKYRVWYHDIILVTLGNECRFKCCYNKMLLKQVKKCSLIQFLCKYIFQSIPCFSHVRFYKGFFFPTHYVVNFVHFYLFFCIIYYTYIINITFTYVLFYISICIFYLCMLCMFL